MFAQVRIMFRVNLVALLLLVSPAVAAADDDQRVAAAEATLKPLRERLEKAQSADYEQLKRELLAFRRAFAGTPQMIEVSRMLGKLPNPMDSLDPKTIPELDRFEWQPPELVSVLGEHRGRHGGPVQAVAYSPDGKWVASGGGNYAIRIWTPPRCGRSTCSTTAATSCAWPSTARASGWSPERTTATSASGI